MEEKIEILSKLFGLPAEELMYPKIIFLFILPLASNLLFFYGLNEKLKIFGHGVVNSIISIFLGIIFSLFTIKLYFIGYALSSVGIAFLFFKETSLRIVILILLISLFFGVQFIF